MSHVVEKARRGDSAVSDSCLEVFEGPPSGRGKISWGLLRPDVQRGMLPANRRGRKIGKSEQLSDNGNGALMPPKAISSHCGKFSSRPSLGTK